MSVRSVSEAVPSGPAGGQLVPQFPARRENNEVLQLHAGQQPASASDLHARHVVRHQEESSLTCTHAQTRTHTNVCFEERKDKGTVVRTALLLIHTLEQRVTLIG